MRDPYPVNNVPTDVRYDGVDQDRWSDAWDYHKGPAGTYNYMGTTLEEEADNCGWTFGAMPTGPPPRDLMTIGMRGEPGFDDDPQYGSDGQFRHTTPEHVVDNTDID